MCCLSPNYPCPPYTTITPPLNLNQPLQLLPTLPYLPSIRIYHGALHSRLLFIIQNIFPHTSTSSLKSLAYPIHSCNLYSPTYPPLPALLTPPPPKPLSHLITTIFIFLYISIQIINARSCRIELTMHLLYREKPILLPSFLL